MTTEEKCRAIVQALLDMVNAEHKQFDEAYAKAPKKMTSITINGVTIDDIEEAQGLDVSSPDPTAPVVSLGPDWGGNAMTIYYQGSHTHVGATEATFDQFVNSMYRLLCEGDGLSWA